ALCLLALMSAARAVEPSERLRDPALEARARAISQELRCVVCQNETIDESGADIAHDLRVLLRQRLLAGDTDQQAINYIVARYGQFLLLAKGARPAPERSQFDRAVYRDQLRELERDAARGLIGPREAATARLEIERRLLAAE